jgi:hypothetical protein
MYGQKEESSNGVHVQNISMHLSVLVAPVKWIIVDFARKNHLVTHCNNSFPNSEGKPTVGSFFDQEHNEFGFCNPLSKKKSTMNCSIRRSMLSFKS